MEGFDGTGKSTVARETVRRAEAGGWRAALLRPSESRATAADDLILEIAQELAFKGEKGLVQALDQGQDLWEALARVLSGTRTLLVIDEAQVAMLDEGGRLPTEVYSFVRQVAGRVQQGRLLLVSDRAFPDGLASGRHTIRRLDGLTDQEAVAYLTGRLTADGIPDAVPPERRLEVVRALGNNLDAIQILGVALRDEDSLDELIGLEPDLWSIDDRQFDPKLLKDLERKLLARILSRLEPDTRRVLGRYSVHRKPIKAKAFKTAQVGIPDLIQRRAVLVHSFLVQHHTGWDAPRPLVREIVLAQLQAQPQERRGYHSLAADHYTRHFEAREVKEQSGLGGYFVEARYHLTRAGRDDELGRIAAHFQDHLSRTIESVTPVPVDREELDERIALLLGLYRDNQGPAGIEYHLARCLAQRDGPDDWREALRHARRACGPRAPAATWVLRFRLEARKSEIQSLQRTIREGIGYVAPEQNRFALYQSGAELLAQAGEADEAIDLLRDGIELIPADKGLFSLYQSAAEMLTQAGDTGEAIELLRDGIERIPADQSLSALYQSAAEMLAQTGQTDEAIKLLHRGIDCIEPQHSLSTLYQAASEILARQGDYPGALDLLKDGLQRIPPGKWSRERVGESALYLSLVLRNASRIEELVSAQGLLAGEEHQCLLGHMFIQEIAGLWRDAAERAGAARERVPRYLHLALHEAFAWLCAGEPGRAAEAMDRFPGDLRQDTRTSGTWLTAFIALAQGDDTVARESLAAYLDQPLEATTGPDRETLLRLWDRDAERHGPVPAFIHPTLPPSLTGRPVRLTRLLSDGPVLDRYPMTPSPAHEPQPCILAIATEWWSRNGGLSTFNRDLCKALAAAGRRVVCLVPRCDADEQQDAQTAHVDLIAARPRPGLDAMHWLLGRPELPDGLNPVWVIGHDRITGPGAQMQHEQFFPAERRIQIIHTAPGESEWHKDHAEGPGATVTADERERLQLDLARGADLVVAVGPRLTRAFANLLAGLQCAPPLHRLDPGLGSLESRNGVVEPQCLLLGRAEDDRLKGLDIAARALGRPSIGTKPPRLVVRGAAPGTGDRLRRELLAVAGRDGLDIKPHEYSAQVERLQEDLRRASVLLMPSRSEGFGLVAMEAIAAGVPILVSDRSGIAELLIERLGAERAGQFVVPTDRGEDVDADAWAQQIRFVLLDQDAADRRAQQLYADLAPSLTWAGAVQGLLGAMGRVETEEEAAAPN